MPKHNWTTPKGGRCTRCGVTRSLAPGRPRFPTVTPESQKLDKGRENSPWDYRLPDRGATLQTRPACAGKGESRHSRKAGRRARVLAASRAGGTRLLSREEQARRAARAAASCQPVAILDAGPTETTPEAPVAS